MTNNRFMIFVFLSTLIIVLGWSCTDSSINSLQTPANFNSIQKETISKDTSQSYELYLPASYTRKKAYPVILLFDPHQNGQLAVEKFKESAELFGYILAASNNAGNGIPNTNAIAENLLNDVSAKFNTDKERIYTAGFSGGARIAISYAINSKKVKGIIACSAGLSNSDPVFLVQKMDIYGIAGFEDFNCREITAMPMLLKNSTWRNTIDLFDGGHAWPPMAFIKKAVLWHEFNAMKDELISKNNKLIDLARDTLSLDIDKAIANKRFLLAEQKTQSAISFFNSLKKTNELDSKLKMIRNTREYKEEMGIESQLRQQEMELQNVYINNFTTQDIAWWRKEISNLNNQIAKSNNLLQSQMINRIKGFLGIVCYSYTSNSIENNELDKAEKYIAVYELIEPENPDCYFFKAVLLDKRGKSAEAKNALKKSMDLGYNNHQKILTVFSKEVVENLNE